MKNTESIINWFKNISNKHFYKFLVFDIKDLYPLIKEKLLWEAISFAKRHIYITNKDIEAIFHARMSLTSQWQTIGRKRRKQLWCYNGRLWWGWGMWIIGIFMLSLLSKHINRNHVGLYRVDGLAILKNNSSSEAEKFKKKFQKLFNRKYM